ncbi:3'-5' exonuclease eri1-related [Anaeramoeba ignava]|uniref:3'-5' exonuclease eri1-related n=1 Tax=Anaeramoeba ignava TaxID=1746090 RepID=A0A9Q0LGQ5_ANAIG|nr:3'-5' exonuclease eri1-related [Anaeramoeba ignava]
MFDFLLVLDFEATCGGPCKGRLVEIIEMPTLILNTKTLKIEDTFHSYIRPEIFPRLTKFCENLTGIEQEIVDKSPVFIQVLFCFEKWLISHNLIDSQRKKIGNWTFITCGNSDLQTLLTYQLVNSRMIQRPDYFNDWIDLQKVFSQFYKSDKPGLMNMLNHLNFVFRGTLHSGIDDAQNTARIVVKMIQDGAIFDETFLVYWKTNRLWREYLYQEKKNYQKSNPNLKENQAIQTLLNISFSDESSSESEPEDIFNEDILEDKIKKYHLLIDHDFNPNKNINYRTNKINRNKTNQNSNQNSNQNQNQKNQKNQNQKNQKNQKRNNQGKKKKSSFQRTKVLFRIDPSSDEDDYDYDSNYVGYK